MYQIFIALLFSNNLDGSEGTKRYKQHTRHSTVILGEGRQEIHQRQSAGRKSEMFTEMWIAHIVLFDVGGMGSGVRIHCTAWCVTHLLAQCGRESAVQCGREGVVGARCYQLEPAVRQLPQARQHFNCGAVPALRYTPLHTLHHCSGESASARGYRGRPGAVLPSLTPDLEQGGHSTQRSLAGVVILQWSS